MTTTNKDCCPQCREIVAVTHNCDCHELSMGSTPSHPQKEENNWEERFDTKYGDGHGNERMAYALNPHILRDLKSFIQSTIHTERIKVLERVLEDLARYGCGKHKRLTSRVEVMISVSRQVINQQQTVSAPTPPVSE